MSRRFRLKSFILLITATAVWLGSLAAAYRVSGELLQPILLTSSLLRLPVFLVFVIGAIMVLERREMKELPSRLALASLILGTAREAVAPLVVIGGMPVLAWIHSRYGGAWIHLFASATLDAFVWGLLLAAFLLVSVPPRK
jgi:hypothetical protein